MRQNGGVDFNIGRLPVMWQPHSQQLVHRGPRIFRSQQGPGPPPVNPLEERFFVSPQMDDTPQLSELKNILRSQDDATAGRNDGTSLVSQVP